MRSYAQAVAAATNKTSAAATSTGARPAQPRPAPRLQPKPQAPHWPALPTPPVVEAPTPAWPVARSTPAKNPPQRQAPPQPSVPSPPVVAAPAPAPVPVPVPVPAWPVKRATPQAAAPKPKTSAKAAAATPSAPSTPVLQAIKTDASSTPMSPASESEAANGDVLTELPRLTRCKTLTKAESDDFENAEVPEVLERPHTPASLSRSSSKDKVEAEEESDATGKRIGPKDFDLLCVIGQGAYGKVIQVRHKLTDEVLAMKIVSNKFIVQKKSMAYLQTERDIMTKINHPFLISLRYAFQTAANVYLVMPFVAGGELFHHLAKQGLLLESSAKFYAAEMVLALEHLHGLGIIHRDLKPENVLLDGEGHIQLTDFGLAKEMAHEEDSAKTMCGTNEYMAPEMIRGKAYNQAVDWWALGALIYEMVTGYPPFEHKNRTKLHHKILNEKLTLPKWLGHETHSILKQLLERNVDKRLGSGKSTMFRVRGVQAIKDHPFFKDIDWHLLAQRKLQPPIVPVIANNTDTSYFSEEFTKLAVGRPSRAESGDGKLFARFSFNANDPQELVDALAAVGDAATPIEPSTTNTPVL